MLNKLKLKKKYLIDGTLNNFHYDWDTSILVVSVRGIKPESDIIEDFDIVFREVRKITLPHEKDYGQSNVIESFKRIEKSKYVIHVSSGDSIRVIANICDCI